MKKKQSAGSHEASVGQIRPLSASLERLSQFATRWSGSSWAFILACLVIVAWLVTGPIFHYSDTWQLVINTGTTIVTFLMVFLIQRSQNKESLAVQLKLNEIVAAIEGASNRMVDVEELSEGELDQLRSHYKALADLTRRESDVCQSHSIDEARHRHESKKHARNDPTHPDRAARTPHRATRRTSARQP
ncbi:MAG TPA: low affinity iron permease family protein [Phycisphaerae bacterium]|nr:low affinity iron permease family protein [Phycisphaerae bacterium]